MNQTAHELLQSLINSQIRAGHSSTATAIMDTVKQFLENKEEYGEQFAKDQLALSWIAPRVKELIELH